MVKKALVNSIVMEDCNSNTVIDIQHLQKFLKRNREHCWASDRSSQEIKTLICKVSQQLHHTHKNVFDPIVVSIGPHYHGKHSLQTMEKRKWRYLDYILEASSKNLDDYLKGLWEVYPLAKSYYSDEIKIASDRFLQMFLLDGCFILLVLCKIDFISNDHNLSLLDDNRNPAESWQYYFVKNDLMLVENQIPFVVIRRVYELITGEENALTSLTDQITSFVEQHLLNIPKAIQIPDRPKSFHHLLHLCHMYLRPSENLDYISMQFHKSRQSLHQCHRATEYHVAGLKFEKREFDENNPHSLLDVRLSENILEIPHLIVDENITTIFRNLIAFEQLNPQFGNDITAYVIFLCMLIKEADDVHLFVSHGIIEHHFQSDEEVASMFAELGLGVDFDLSGDYYLKIISQNLESFYQSHTKWWKGWLRRASSMILNLV